MTSDQELASRLAALSPAQRALFDQLLASSGADVGIHRRPFGDKAPASYEQERLWFMNQLVAHPEIFHVPTALWLRGPLDVPALERSLQALIRRHEALRTVFRDTGDGPRQIILAGIHTPLRIEDCTELTTPREDAVARASASVQEGFDLAEGPLIRARLYKTDREEHLLALVQHHIVSDYWSLGILLADLGSLYAAELGMGPTPPPLDLHYADFAHWQRHNVDSSRVADQIRFWRETLSGAPESLDFPIDRSRPAIRTSRGKFYRVRFGPELTHPLREMARQHSTTLLVAYLASYIGLLSRMVRNDSVVVGVPMAGRARPELQGMIGYFLNWLPIHVHVADRPTLSELVGRTATAMSQAMANQDVPFDMLVQELRGSGGSGSTPIFQTSFSLRDGAPQAPCLPGLEVRFAELEGGATHFDLMVELWSEDEEVVGYLPYDEELFDEATVAAWACRLQRLIDLGTKNPAVPVSNLPIISDDEQVRLNGAAVSVGVSDSPDTDTSPGGGTLHGSFADQVRRRPWAPAIKDEELTLDYAELDLRANRVAHALQARGVRPGEVVGLLGDRTVDLIAGLIGVLKAGAAYLPVDPDAPAERAATQFTDSSVRTILALPERTLALPPDCPPPLILDWTDPEFADESPVCVDVPDASPAYIIYTSGSTGVPKGVMVSHANVRRLFETTSEVVDFGEDDVWTLFHSIAFDFSVWEIWGALAHGGSLVVVPQWIARAPDVFAELLKRERVTVLSQTPSAFGQLARVILKRPDLLRDTTMRHIIFGGETLPFTMLRDWLIVFGEHHPRLTNMYGITETTVHATSRRIHQADMNVSDSLIGSPLADLSLYILDENLQPVPVGVTGEVFIGGPGVATGYVADPALTARRMLPDPWFPARGARMYRSGDRAVMRRGGEIAYVGRLDNQYKIRGHRVELGDVQAAVDGLDEVAQSVVIALNSRFGGSSLEAFAVLNAPGTVSGTAIRRLLLNVLPEWMVPASVHVVQELPLTRNGKIDREVLLASRRQLSRERVALNGDAQTALARIWSDLLGIPEIHADDHFFELGGHSLMVVQLVSRIHQKFGVELPMHLLFEHPQLQQMAEAISELVGATPEPPATGLTGVISEPGMDEMSQIREDIRERLRDLPRPNGRVVLDAETKTILLTGASGFVGAFTLAAALADGHQVICLLRGGESRRADLLKKLDQLGLRNPKHETRLRLVNGDLGKPMLGLTEWEFASLTEIVTCIVNVGARVNHIYPYEQLAAENTHSLKELLRLASSTPHQTCLVHVSTSSVVDAPADSLSRPFPAGPLTCLPTAANGYVRSKAVAEEYVSLAGEHDVPGTVVRIGSVFGDFSRFQINPADAVWSWALAMLDTARYPESFDDPTNELFQALPADVVAQVLLRVATTAREPGCTWVNAIPEKVFFTHELITALRILRTDLLCEPDSEWYRRVASLDTRRVWVAGLAREASRRASGGASPKQRLLRRFDCGSDPLVRELVSGSCVGAEEVVEYLRTLAHLASNAPRT